ncbi:MAG: hypothetical protein RLZZ303_855 [Candidatus Hydrogenedentota bacterium]|jgi:glycosyltransferase involved in cell wall biosynthesis
MRILHLDEQMGWRGGESQASWLIQGSVRRGHAVWIAARPGSRFLDAPHGGVSLTRVASSLRSELDLPSALRLARLARRERIEIVHAHTSHAHSIALLCRMFYPSLKVVAHRRVSFPPKRDPLNRWKYRAPDRIVCVSAKVLEVLRDSGLPAEKLRLVHSAVDLSRLEVPAIDRAALGVPAAARLIFSAGALVGHKDHANLIDAFARVHAAMPDTYLLIAGEGTLRGELEARIERLGITACARLLGQRDDVPAITHAADVYVSSSWSEGLGTSVLEGLGCGTPVVATEAGGAAEMVRQDETGRLVPCRDVEALAAAIRDCLENPEDSRRMAQAGQKLVHEFFGVDRMVEGNLAVYRELLGQ